MKEVRDWKTLQGFDFPDEGASSSLFDLKRSCLVSRFLCSVEGLLCFYVVISVGSSLFEVHSYAFSFFGGFERDKNL